MSTIATIGIFNFKASFTASSSTLVSTIKIISGIFFISAIPPNDLSNLSRCIPIFKFSFFVKPVFSFFKSAESFFKRFIELDIVCQFVSIPPSHLLFT